MTLSVVIVIASDTVRRPAAVDHLRHCLRALHAQAGRPALDVIVPHLPGIAGIAYLSSEFPAVRFLPVPEVARRMPRGPWRDHHDELRARGVAAARGEIVALLEDHEVPDPRWAAGVLAAHEAWGGAAIGGAVENSIPRALNEAVFLCDFAQYLNPLGDCESSIATDVNVSYKREALNEVAPVWQSRFHERRVHEALLARGERLMLSGAIVVHQRRNGLTAGDAIVERFAWGRSFASSRCEGWWLARRLTYAVGTPLLPALLTARIVLAALSKRHSVGVAVIPWLVVLSTAWAFGELAGYIGLRRRPVAGVGLGEAVQTP